MLVVGLYHVSCQVVIPFFFRWLVQNGNCMRNYTDKICQFVANLGQILPILDLRPR